MGIAFNEIPALLRLPGHYIEFDSSMAGSTQRMATLLLPGNMLATGTANPLEPYRITSADQAKVLFGQGSMLATMLIALYAIQPQLEIWAIGVEDDAAAAAGTSTMIVQATATKTGIIPLYIDGLRIRVAVTEGDDAQTIATNIAAAITAESDAQMSAAYNFADPDHTVVLTSKNKSEAANGIQIRAGIYADETLPEGVTLTIPDVANGVGNPDFTDVIGAMGDEWYNYIVMPWTDSANLQILENELDNLWGPMLQRDARAFIAWRGTHAATGTFGKAHNSPHISCMGTNDVPQSPYIWAAVNAIVAANALRNHPARPLGTLELTGLLPPAKADAWTDTERNLLLFDGIATYKVSATGDVVIERQITMYQMNDSGFADTAFLDINVPETLSRIRYEQRARSAKEYPRHMLANDGDNYPPGQPIVTPKAFKGFLITLYQEFIDDGWVEDLANYIDTLLVELDVDDQNRLNYVDQPNLMNQLQIVAGRTQFRS